MVAWARREALVPGGLDSGLKMEPTEFLPEAWTMGGGGGGGT